MIKRPLILITNDDGIESPGLRAAARAVADLGDLLIIAPSTQQTGAGRSYPGPVDKITVHTTEIPLTETSHVAYYADVSPAQAVAVGVLELAKRSIDLCISGINYGENLGSAVTMSGTVGAAIEAACFDIPALAVSIETPQAYHYNPGDDIDFRVAAHFTRHFAQKALAKGLPPFVDLLKIDVPASVTLETDWRVARVSRQRYYQPLPDKNNQGNKTKSFDYRIHIDHDTLEPDSDIYVFALEKSVSVVPMTIDLTAPVALPKVMEFFEL